MAPSVEVAGVQDTRGIQMPDPLTLNSVQSARSKAGKLVAGTAARADIELFLGGRHSHKNKAKRWDDRLSDESKTRVPSSLKGAAKYLARPGMISLGGGLPSAEYFPFDQITMKVPSPGQPSEAATHASGTTVTANKYDMRDDASLFDISVAFNYGQGTGSPQLLRFVTEHTEIVHNPPYADWASNLTIGSTSGWDCILRMFGRPGMVILSEEYTFSSAVETAVPMGILTEPVKMDDQGLLPGPLDEMLTGWDPAAHGGADKPFLLYTIPSGQNPTGATQSLERRRAIYGVAQKHDLLVVEDEPYYFLQMQPYTGRGSPAPPAPASHDEFLRSLVPSYLSLDTDGRVLRLDSFSKLIAPGSRVGWVTGPTQLVERFARHVDVSTQGPSGVSQLVLYKLLDEHWGHGGYLDWLVHLRMEYSRRRDSIVGACEQHLPRAVVSWKPPAAGMFHWLRVEWRRHPQAGRLAVRELEERIWMRAIERGALLIKGSWFRADQGRLELGTEEEMFFRCTFCAASEEKITEAIRRFGEAVREEFELGPEEGEQEEGGAKSGEANGNGTALSNGNGAAAANGSA